MRGRRAYLAVSAAVAAALLAAPGGARGEFTLRYLPQYLNTDTQTIGANGAVSQTETSALDQKFLLDFNRALYPSLLLNLNGMYDWNLGTIERDGTPGEFDSRRWSLYGILKAGDRQLNGGLDYTRNEQSGSALTGAVAAFAPTRVSERYGAFGFWAVPDLPRVDLRLGRINQFDTSRRLFDLTEDDASANVLYTLSDLEADYRFRWAHPVDQIGGTDTTAITHTGFLGYSARLLQERLVVAGTYQLQAQSIDTHVRNTAAEEARVVPVAQGLSAIDTGTSPIPGQIRLDSNSALVDGDFDTGAGLDIGYRPALSGDVNPRNVGVQLQDLTTRVDAVYLYVDRLLPAPIVAAYAWEAYRSDDNLTWTPVAITGPVKFGTFRNRFEIPIGPTTGSRYLKVVVRPLNPAVTTDPLYEHVLVTEIQPVELLTAAELLGHQDVVSGIATGTLRLRLLRAPNLAYEFSGFLTHTSVGGRVAYDLTNALSLDHPLTRILTGSARVERTDSFLGGDLGHEATSRLGASLGLRPNAAASASISYAGQVRESARGTAITNTALLFGRADPYRGISLGTNASYSLGRLETGRDTRGVLANVSASAVPGRALSLTGGYSFTQSTETGKGLPASTTETQRIDGTAVLNPFRALQASVTGSRVLANGRWYTLANFGGSFSPLQGGELVLSFVYNETLDTSAQYRVRTWGPMLRWNLRSGAYAEASYSDLDSSEPSLRTRIQTIAAKLYLPLI